MIRTTRNTVQAWAHAEPDKLTERFWNMILRDAQLTVDLNKLVKLFGIAAPSGRTKYNHHDGYRS